MTDTLQGVVVHGMSDAEYHARSELSSTGARWLLDLPAKFHYRQTHPQPHKDAYDLGSAVHTKVLGVGANIITYPDEHLAPSGAVSTKAATVAWADEKRAEGYVLIGTAQAAQVDGMAEALLAHPEARGLLETIEGREVTIITEIDSVPVRARFDIYNGTQGGDLKSARDASPKGFNAAIARNGYFIQEQWYREAHTAVNGTDLETFKFLVVESSAPYLVGVYDLDFMWEDLAKERTATARQLWRRCTETNTWPGYQSATLTPPTWAIYENEEQEVEIA